MNLNFDINFDKKVINKLNYTSNYLNNTNFKLNNNYIEELDRLILFCNSNFS